MKLQSIAPANGWYFTAWDQEGRGVIFKVAVWATTESGEVVGLIAATNMISKQGVPSLVMPPTAFARWTYTPEEGLTQEQRDSLRPKP